MPKLKVDYACLLCPDCHSKLSRNYVCLSCGRRFSETASVWNFLPKLLESNKRSEDTVHLKSNPDKKDVIEHPWKFLLQKKKDILRFEEEDLPRFNKGRFLELAAETCWASSLFKLAYQDSEVFATDISPRSLKVMGTRLSAVLEADIDHFLALDAENIPFRDNFFDSVFITTAMHHLNNPVKMLNEVYRVLKKGGVFIAHDGAHTPISKLFFKNEAEERSKKYGILENTYPFRKWEMIIRESKIPLMSLNTYTNPKYQESLFMGLAVSFLNCLPKSIVKAIFPVGITIYYKKVS